MLVDIFEISVSFSTTKELEILSTIPIIRPLYPESIIPTRIRHSKWCSELMSVDIDKIRIIKNGCLIIK